MGSRKAEKKDLEARFGQPLRSLTETGDMPGVRPALYFLAFVLGCKGLADTAPSLFTWESIPAELAFWFGGSLFLALYGGGKLYRDLVRSWRPTLHERGIVLRRWKTPKSFAFDEVKTLEIQERDVFHHQELYGRQWDVTLVSDADRATFRLRTRDGQEDLAGELVQELRDALAEVAGRRLRQGRELAGAGWRLTQDGLKTRSGEVPFEEIAGADFFGGGRVGVWKLGEESPFFTVAARSANAMVLYDVLASRLPSHALGLGRVQFQKRVSLLPGIVAGLLAIPPLLSALRLFDDGYVNAALSQGAFGILLVAVSYMLAAQGFVCYERGLINYAFFVRREIQFADVAGLTYRSWQFRIKGVYIFTSLSLILYRRQGGDPLRVAIVRRRVGDRDVEGLRDRLAERLADTLIERLDQEGKIRWTEGLWLTRQGVHYPTSTPRPDRETQTSFIHYSQGALYTFEGGEFFLYRKGDRKPVWHESAGAPNFFVGFALFERLAAEARESREAGEGA